MKILVTGGPGQLVLSMAERGRALGYEVVAVGPPVLDLAQPDDDAIYAALTVAQPDAIVNAAAHTAVDRAESEPELAFAINGEGAGAVARAAKRLGVPLVHVSTDYVFAGDKCEPYVESDPTGPTGVYGASKLVGEEAVLASGADAAVLRTAWVYSPFGNNFVKTMLRLASSRDELSVVADQYGCPTNALDLADVCIAVAANLVASGNPAMRGVFHATGQGEGTWADFAEAVFAASAAEGGPSVSVNRITTAQYPTSAKRPANSRLNGDKLATAHGVRLPAWQTSLVPVVARLVKEIQENVA
ncbi:dTDP-4-dehydrorhamnose reductase [Novosphingobium sediminicola]|uniref:dTDP-4-dehydrorhamnose reductase n=1 Tax=Novosphingobium sediminicola TaxID=563162 RepID=A0A7W6CJS4_9SPHN|nr:dTDP-4-dehydrorhamnose reductase [Novosphingobium sediminicola]MBB3957779.1 dTDP-4-dehydrorhamnose reductase [Novosphingobium sediminicola]